jgi:hypothetical protein
MQIFSVVNGASLLCENLAARIPVFLKTHCVLPLGIQTLALSQLDALI